MSKSKIGLKRLMVIPAVLPLLIYSIIVNFSVAESSLDVNVWTDNPSYILRQLVNIDGNATYNGQPIEEGLAGIEIEDPNRTIVIRTVPVGSIPSETWKSEIISFYPCDAAGNPKYSFLRGEWAYFRVTVRNNAPVTRTVLITVNIYDNSTIPLELAAAKVPIGAGLTATFMPKMWIDSWAKTGDAVAYANVYTDWPKNQGYPDCPEKPTTFKILESEYEEEEAPGSPPKILAGENGTFKLSFRLSPEPPPGTYLICTTVFYKGWTSTTSATFQVDEVPAAPWPDFVIKPPVAGPNFEVTFDASSSSAEGYGDYITNYYWDFGDGTNATGKTVTHSYSEVGNYTVTLNVTDSEGLWNITSKKMVITIIHDIAITELRCIDEIYNDWLAPITITVKNEGTVTETFNVTIYSNSTPIEIITVTDIGPLEKQTFSFKWNTTGLEVCSYYIIEAIAETLENETDTVDNALSYGPIWVKLLGDVNGDRVIDIYDVVRVATVYASSQGDPGWDIMADLKPDGKIDIYDVVIVCSKYATSY